MNDEVRFKHEHGVRINSAAVDDNGNIYYGFNDRTVKKVSSSGKIIWTFNRQVVENTRSNSEQQMDRSHVSSREE